MRTPSKLFLLPCIALLPGIAGCDRGFLRDTPRPLPATDTGSCTLRRPTDVQAVPTAVDRIDVTWTNSEDGATSFVVQRDRDGAGFVDWGDPVAAPATTFADTDVEPDTPYRYRVLAKTGSCESDWSDSVPATGWPYPVIDTTRDVDPVSGGLIIGWEDANVNNTEASYDIDRLPAGGTTVERTWTVPGSGPLTITDDTVPGDGEYDYRIETTTTDNITVSATFPFWTPPNAPGNVTTTPDSTTSVVVAWTDTNVNETDYSATRYLAAALTDLGYFGADATGFTDDGSLPAAAPPPISGETYTYEICAEGPGGTTCATPESGRSALPPQLTADPAPVLDASCQATVGSATYDTEAGAGASLSNLSIGDGPEGCGGLTGLSSGPDALVLEINPGLSGRLCTYAVGWTLTDTLTNATTANWTVTSRATATALETSSIQPMVGMEVSSSAATGCGDCATGTPAQIELGGSFSCATVLGDGLELLNCWGSAAQLGFGIGTDYAYPRPICGAASLSNFGTTSVECGDKTVIATAVAAGGGHICAIDGTGRVGCWGDDTFGQLGRGVTGLAANVPAAVCLDSNMIDQNPAFPYYICTGGGDLTGVSAIAAGDMHTCAVMSDMTARCWGNNAFDQLGRGPVGGGNLALPTNVCKIGSSGPQIACAGTTPEELNNIEAIAAGGRHTCALVTGGAAICWGDDAQGQLGNIGAGGTEPNTGPVLQENGSPLTNAIAIAAGREHSCALYGSGVVTCWGSNSGGQAGSGDLTSSFFDRAGPVCVAGNTRGGEMCVPDSAAAFGSVVAIAAGDLHTCALREDGTVWCWGDNAKGQLGAPESLTESPSPLAVCSLGDTDPSTGDCPTASDRLDGIVALAAGGEHTCAVRFDGQLFCWGDNTWGQAGSGDTPPFTGPFFRAGQVCTDRSERPSATDTTCSNGTTTVPGYNDAQTAPCWTNTLEVQP